LQHLKASTNQFFEMDKTR